MLYQLVQVQHIQNVFKEILIENSVYFYFYIKSYFVFKFDMFACEIQHICGDKNI